MEIFKLLEATLPNTQPDHPSNKKLRRDELLDNYDAAAKTLDALIKAKENELAYRRELIDLLEKSKIIYNDKLTKAKEAYQLAKKHAPDTPEFKGAIRKSDPIAPSSSTSTPTFTTPTLSLNNPTTNLNHQTPLSHTSSDSLDIPMPSEAAENRSSLDRRLSEFLKTFPNLTQAGLAPGSKADGNSNDAVVAKPLPGYYTQHQPPPPPPINAAPPLMAMMRFPPPPMMPPAGLQHVSNINPSSQENHDQADMELSDHEEGGPTTGQAIPIIPMIANALQRGAGGSINETPPQQQTYIAGQQFNQPVQYAPRINSLPFDPSIMEPRLREPSSGGTSRDKHSHSPRGGGHRHSSGGSASGKHGSDKNKYSSSSSSHSSSRSNKRR